MSLRAATQVDHRVRISLIQRYLDDHMDEPISIPALAKMAAYAVHHFHRVFRGVTGESVAGYVRRLKLERAARRLLTSQAPITKLALEAGYDAPEAFTRAFSKAFDIPPSEFRATPRRRMIATIESDVCAPSLIGLSKPSVEIRVVPEIKIVSLRHQGPWAGLGQTFERLMTTAIRDVRVVGAKPTLYGLCHDDPDVTGQDKLRFDACFSLEDGAVKIPKGDGYHLSRIPEGSYAIAVHTGSYATLSDTYLALIGLWLPTTRFGAADEPVVEAYLNDPTTTPEAELKTEVRIRLG